MADRVAVSVVTPWELDVKAAARRLRLPPIDWQALGQRGLDTLAIGLDDVLAAARLPPITGIRSTE